ncbi:hypothetical protein BDR07DRAFT_1487238 [Suillus spraguei]|nr:hypothetical protein BDR07DRAFT_1487238 [Suillus spraguei]
MCTTTHSKPHSTDNSSTNELSYCPPRFTPAGLAALYSNSNFALGFSNGGCQAAACALLRNDSHLDGTHYHTKTLGGLHPAYIAFNKIPLSTERQSLTLSIGPNTDAMLDRFKIGDEAILKLRNLIVTAANLTKALHADLSGTPLGSIKRLRCYYL